MNGTGLHFNSPGVVRIQKTFVQGVDGFDFTSLKATFSSQIVITYLPLTGPSIIPFLAVINVVNVNPGAATEFYITYFSDNNFASVPLITLVCSGVFTANTIVGLNSNAMANYYWQPGGTINAGICMSANQPFGGGDSLTVTLYCVNSGLNY